MFSNHCQIIQRICHLGVAICRLSFFTHFEIFLVLIWRVILIWNLDTWGITWWDSGFSLNPVSVVFFLTSLWQGKKVYHLTTARIEHKFRFSIWPLLSFEEVPLIAVWCRWGFWLILRPPLTDTSLAGGWVVSVLLPLTCPPLTPWGAEGCSLLAAGQW